MSKFLKRGKGGRNSLFSAIWQGVPFNFVQDCSSNTGWPKAKNSLHGLGINIKCTLKESPIHHQNYIEMKTKGVILMGDVGERKEDDGRGCFDEFINSLDPVVLKSETILLIYKHHDEII